MCITSRLVFLLTACLYDLTVNNQPIWFLAALELSGDFLYGPSQLTLYQHRAARSAPAFCRWSRRVWAAAVGHETQEACPRGSMTGFAETHFRRGLLEVARHRARWALNLEWLEQGNVSCCLNWRDYRTGEVARHAPVVYDALLARLQGYLNAGNAPPNS